MRKYIAAALLCAAGGSAILWWPKGKAPAVSSPGSSADNTPSLTARADRWPPSDETSAEPDSPPPENPAAPQSSQEDIEKVVAEKGRDATGLLLRCLEDAKQLPEVRQACLSHLSNFHAKDPASQVRSAALRWMKGKDSFCRGAGLELAQNWPAKDVDKAALDLLDNPNEDQANRLAAAYVLASRGVAEAIPTLREWLREEEPDPKTQKAAILCLATLKDEESRKEIERLARLGTPAQREAAGTGLRNFQKIVTAARAEPSKGSAAVASPVSPEKPK